MARFTCNLLQHDNKKDTFLERNPNEAVAECQGRTRPKRVKQCLHICITKQPLCELLK